jgi:hypothetical protein
METVREGLAVNKLRSHIFSMERFNLKKLNEVESKEMYCVEVSNMFAALEDWDAEVEINSAWEMIRENAKISAKESICYYELKKHKPWFDEGCSELLDQRKQAKCQWLQDHQFQCNRSTTDEIFCIHQILEKKWEYT